LSFSNLNLRRKEAERERGMRIKVSTSDGAAGGGDGALIASGRNHHPAKQNIMMPNTWAYILLV
jgi:hypothetical protein